MKTFTPATENRATRQSLRHESFMLFDLGWRPTEVIRRLNSKPKTIYRYFEDWKKHPVFTDVKYQYAKSCYRNLSPRNRRRIAGILAGELGTSRDEVLVRMRKPWGLKHIVTGQWQEWPVSKKHHNLSARTIKLPLGIRLFGASVETRYIVELALNSDINPLDRILFDD